MNDLSKELELQVNLEEYEEGFWFDGGKFK